MHTNIPHKDLENLGDTIDPPVGSITVTFELEEVSKKIRERLN